MSLLNGLAYVEHNSVGSRAVVPRCALCLAILLNTAVPSTAQAPSDSSGARVEHPTKPNDGSSPDRVVVAKDELAKKLLPDPAVLGIGVGSYHSEPALNVYVKDEASKQTLASIPKKFRGIRVCVVKTGPIKAQ
jgi:hypothetical protein